MAMENSITQRSQGPTYFRGKGSSHRSFSHPFLPLYLLQSGVISDPKAVNLRHITVLFLLWNGVGKRVARNEQSLEI
ncbi:Leukocyte Immunoglobulin-Like Receptor Subfamily B Member 4 [Manis pentadactyla]|nr:Leukocyte Immunoglobulin-Like Receptor Subfamily B Member 4 [Manis pentadactyla]